MRSKLLSWSVLLIVLALPLASACHTWYGGVRAPSVGKEYYVPFGRGFLPDGTGPFPVPEGSVWEETNGLPGFQCETTMGFDGRFYPPDTRVA